MFEKSRNHGNRGRACLALALNLKYEADLIEQLRLPGGAELAGILEQWTGKDCAAKLRTKDSRTVFDEAERLFQRVVCEFHDLEYVYEYRHPVHQRTLRQIAELELYELRHLATGRVAPEIAGGTWTAS